MPQTPAPLSFSQLSSMLGLPQPEGDDGRRFTGITTLELATESDVSFVQRASFAATAETSKAGIIIVPKNITLKRGNTVTLPNVMEGVLSLLEYFHPEATGDGKIHSTAVVDPSAKIGEGVTIGPQVVVEANAVIEAGAVIGAQSFIGAGVVVGEKCILHTRVTLHHGTKVGRRVIIHSGAVIGADGFRYEFARGRLCKIPQVGIVVLEDDVEVGANTTIDRASFSETRIGARTKIDNQVHIGHNVEVGSDSIIVAQVGIAGSVKVGRGVMIGGQTGIADNITIGDRARIAGATGVHGNVAAGAEIIGNPALSKREYARQIIVLKTICEQWPKLRPLLTKGEDEE